MVLAGNEELEWHPAGARSRANRAGHTHTRTHWFHHNILHACRFPGSLSAHLYPYKHCAWERNTHTHTRAVRRYGHMSESLQGEMKRFRSPLCCMAPRLCTSREGGSGRRWVHPTLGWWPRCRPEEIVFTLPPLPSPPVCKPLGTCIAMWRTERAALPGIANPLSSEMSCVAWPRAAQACASRPPRCKELSLRRRLLSELRLPGLISYRRDKRGGGNINLENRLFLARSSSAMTLVAMCCNVNLSNLFQRHVLWIRRRGLSVTRR